MKIMIHASRGPRDVVHAQARAGLDDDRFAVRRVFDLPIRRGVERQLNPPRYAESSLRGGRGKLHLTIRIARENA